ncbi:thyrotropin subunit beta-like [Lampris incognitus]|uniref:thyrotropin subunit beta-like n=1 Tax=Lampris incognitus TaxID=2546036 RepID=UPI0024B53412|nr:thyrotropin subunit beta-like [Lampris incognitus]
MGDNMKLLGWTGVYFPSKSLTPNDSEETSFVLVEVSLCLLLPRVMYAGADWSMTQFVLTCVLLCAWMGRAMCCCMLQNYTFWIERHDCGQCMAVNTTICSGYCYTQDSNLRGHSGRSYLIQRGCLPTSLVYRVAHVPGCPQDAGHLLYYPESRQCRCSRCDKRTFRCVRTGRTRRGACPNKPGRGQTRGSGETRSVGAGL